MALVERRLRFHVDSLASSLVKEQDRLVLKTKAVKGACAVLIAVLGAQTTRAQAANRSATFEHTNNIRKQVYYCD